MKNILTFLLAVTLCSTALAQNKQNLFVDASVLFSPGISATYDFRVINHLDIGAGISSVYFFRSAYRTIYTACYVDIRPYWGKRKHMWFLPVDVGCTYFNQEKQPLATIDPFGFYCSLAYGYQYHINKRGMGPYITAGMFGYSRNVHLENPNIPPAARDYSVFDATSTVAIGFKF